MTLLDVVLDVVDLDSLPAVNDPGDKNIHVGPDEACVHGGIDDLMAVFALPVEFSTVQKPRRTLKGELQSFCRTVSKISSSLIQKESLFLKMLLVKILYL